MVQIERMGALRAHPRADHSGPCIGTGLGRRGESEGGSGRRGRDGRVSASRLRAQPRRIVVKAATIDNAARSRCAKAPDRRRRGATRLMVESERAKAKFANSAAEADLAAQIAEQTLIALDPRQTETARKQRTPSWKWPAPHGKNQAGRRNGSPGRGTGRVAGRRAVPSLDVRLSVRLVWKASGPCERPSMLKIWRRST